ncbi:MAG: hypothetical protein WAP51_01855 [Candidatus Sungiibacteriota bacterium]
MKRWNVCFVVLLLAVAFALQACSAVLPAAYPMRNQSAVQASRDIAECEAWAKQQTGYDPAMDTLKGGAIGAVIGAVGGAAAGAAIGAATGNPGKGAAIGAAAGGIGGVGVGGAVGLTKSRASYEHAYASCMLARGYAVGGKVPIAPAPPVALPVSQGVPVCVGTLTEEYGWQPDPRGGPPHYVKTGRYFCNGQLFQ